MNSPYYHLYTFMLIVPKITDYGQQFDIASKTSSGLQILTFFYSIIVLNSFAISFYSGIAPIVSSKISTSR